MASNIASVGELVRVIQTQLSVATAGVPKRARARRTGGSPYAPGKLEQLIELRIRQLGRDDPQRGRKAFRVFLEAVLLSHFGDELVNDPQFYQMVDDVQQAMECEPAVAQMVGQAIEHLLAKA